MNSPLRLSAAATFDKIRAAKTHFRSHFVRSGAFSISWAICVASANTSSHLTSRPDLLQQRTFRPRIIPATTRNDPKFNRFRIGFQSFGSQIGSYLGPLLSLSRSQLLRWSMAFWAVGANAADFNDSAPWKTFFRIIPDLWIVPCRPSPGQFTEVACCHWVVE